MTNEVLKELYELEVEIARLRTAVSALSTVLWILVPLVAAGTVACALGH